MHATVAKAETERMEKLLGTIEAHPLTIRFREDQAAATLAKRQEAAAKIEAIRQEAEAFAPMQAEIDGMIDRLAIMDRERADLLAEVNGKRGALARVKVDHSTAIAQQDGILSSTCDPKIPAAIVFFRDKLDDLRRPGRIFYDKRGAVKNLINWTKTATVESNEAAILGAMRFCQDAIAELERMRLRPELDAARIERMKASIPRIDIFEEAEAERPMEKVHESPLRAIAARLEVEIPALLAKADALLGKRR